MKLPLATALALINIFGAEVRVTDRILPLIQDGGGTSTTITIVNLESTTSSFEILFLTDTGAYWRIPVSRPAGVVTDGHYVRGVLGAGRSLTIRTAGTGDLSLGHATIYSAENARLGVNLRVNPAGWAFNAAPQREDTLTLPFDNADGANTMFLWVSDTPFTLVTYVATGDDGKVLANGRYQFSVSDNVVQRVLALTDLAPATAGQRGIVSLQIDYPNAGIYDELYFTGLAIQTDPNGVSVVNSSMSTGTWKSTRH